SALHLAGADLGAAAGPGGDLLAVCAGTHRAGGAVAGAGVPGRLRDRVVRCSRPVAAHRQPVRATIVRNRSGVKRPTALALVLAAVACGATALTMPAEATATPRTFSKPIHV